MREVYCDAELPINKLYVKLKIYGAIQNNSKLKI